MKTSQSIVKLMPDLVKAQAKIEAVKKDNTATVPTRSGGQFKYTYADLPSVIDAVKPTLNENNLVFLQPVCGDVIQTWIIHESGEWVCDDGVRILNAKPDDPQAQGSAITYARRYGLMSMLGIPAEDDDGEKAMNRDPEPKSFGKRVDTPQQAKQASLGNCEKCGAPNSWSEEKQRKYCSKLCWKTGGNS